MQCSFSYLLVAPRAEIPSKSQSWTRWNVGSVYRLAHSLGTNTLATIRQNQTARSLACSLSRLILIIRMYFTISILENGDGLWTTETFRLFRMVAVAWSPSISILDPGREICRSVTEKLDQALPPNARLKQTNHFPSHLSHSASAQTTTSALRCGASDSGHSFSQPYRASSCR